MRVPKREHKVLALDLALEADARDGHPPLVALRHTRHHVGEEGAYKAVIRAGLTLIVLTNDGHRAGSLNDFDTRGEVLGEFTLRPFDHDP